MIVSLFLKLSPIWQAFLAGIFTWGVTAVGAAVVFLTKEVSKKMLDALLGFAGGVMIAASVWSLLLPSIEMSKSSLLGSWFPSTVGFVLGGIFLRLADRIVPHLHVGFKMSEAEGIKTRWHRSTLLVLAITLHNIPEGLAVGVAFGAVASGFPEATLAAALALTLGIGIQNFPEGLAVSVPLRRAGMGRLRSFWYGQLSGFVEPVASVIGAAAVILAKPLLPYAMGFAAGAMIFVVVEEVIPESQRSGNTDLATGGALGGFLVMMILDVAFS